MIHTGKNKGYTTKFRNNSIKITGRLPQRVCDLWYQDKGNTYLCSKCKKWFLLNEFNLSKRVCNNCHQNT